LAGAGLVAFCAGLVVGGNAVALGAVTFLGATLIALGEATRQIVTWPNATIVFVGLVWLVPIKLYRLPVDLPFQLEVYRVAILLLVLALVVSSMYTGREVSAAGVGVPLFALAAAALLSQVVNARSLEVPGQEGQALKSLSFFLSFIIVFLVVASTFDRLQDVDRVVTALVVGGIVVAVAAIYEGRTLYNVFDHLDGWIPFARNEREVFDFRGGRLRVHASAQHPIALGAALMMMVPLAVYLAQKAATTTKGVAWMGGGGVLLIGALTTISRTTVMMGAAMLLMTVWLRPRVVARLWPLLLVLPLIAHVAAPGALGGLAKSFGLAGGEPLIESVQGRAGESGSGRLDDIDPALDLWSRSPIVGLGIDSPEIVTTAPIEETTGQTPAVPLIFDNQYLHTLVTLGLLGIVGTVWFVWGSTLRLASAAKRTAGDDGHFLTACAVVCAGYGAGMVFFDSFAYVQATLFLFMVAALGLRTLELVSAPAESGAGESAVTA
jgi:hypothetical protein